MWGGNENKRDGRKMEGESAGRETTGTWGHLWEELDTIVQWKDPAIYEENPSKDSQQWRTRSLNLPLSL